MRFRHDYATGHQPSWQADPIGWGVALGRWIGSPGPKKVGQACRTAVVNHLPTQDDLI